MNGRLEPVVKRQILFVVASLAISLTLSYFFGFIVGLVANMVVLIGAMIYIRYRQQKALKTFGFSDEKVGVYSSGATKLKYVCLACGAEVKSVACKSCGSRMKKPVF
jgi:hypothetical protein